MPALAKATKRCEKKKQFETLDEATRYALMMNCSGLNTRPIKPYPCRVCSKWHNGHPPIVRELIKKYGKWANAVENMEWFEFMKMRDAFHSIAWVDTTRYLRLVFKYMQAPEWAKETE